MAFYVIEKTLRNCNTDAVIMQTKDTYEYEGEAINEYFEEIREYANEYPLYEGWEENSLERGLLTYWFNNVAGFESLTLQVDLYKAE